MLGKIKQIGIRCLDVFENVMTIFAIYLAACSIRELWGEESTQRYSKRSRILLFLFYLLHIAALILATGLFGEFILSASMAVFLVNVTSIINDVFDYVQEYYHNYKRKRKLRELENRIPNYQLIFSQNALIFREFIELKEEVEALNAQQQELVVLNSLLDDKSSPTPQICLEQISKIADMLKNKCEFIVAEQIVIDRYHQKYGFELDENQIIKDTHAAIQVMQERRKQLQEVVDTLKQQSPPNLADIASYERNIEKLDASIRKKAIINKHFFNLSKAREALQDVQRQRSGLDEKYEQPPFNTYEQSEKEQIKLLESNHLGEREAALRQFIENPIQPIPYSEEVAKHDLWTNAQQALEKLNGSQDRETIKEILTEQIKTLEHMIVEANAKFNKQKEFIQAISSNQRQEIILNFDNLYQTGNEIIEIKKQIKLSTLEEKHKLWSTTVSIASACLSVFGRLVAFRFHTIVIEGAIKLVSLFGAMASFYGRNENIRAQRAHRVIVARETEQLNSECAERARLVPDSALRRDCVQIMERMTRKMNERYPLSGSPQRESAPPPQTFTPQADHVRTRRSNPSRIPRSSYTSRRASLRRPHV